MSFDDSIVPGVHRVAERESLLLAPYAMHSRDSAGRKYPETDHPYRGPYQRDKDRILHSAAFRRLSGKTQVFTGDMGDYHRTRLTHTFEVASIARTVCRALRLNEDLVEALALFHDVGHPPYGHAGEAVLDECLADCGGFSHNRHAITIAEELEQRYPSFPGLNLSREVLDSQTLRSDDARPLSSLLEAQVVDTADSIAYDAHDMDDAVKLGLVTLEQLSDIPWIREMMQTIRLRHAGITAKAARKALVHELIDTQVSDLLRSNASRLAARGFDSARAAQQDGFRLSPGAELQQKKVELEQFLHENVYKHPLVMSVRIQAQARMRELFQCYVNDPSRMPQRFLIRAAACGLKRAAGEYLAGMTDRYCEQQHERWHP